MSSTNKKIRHEGAKKREERTKKNISSVLRLLRAFVFFAVKN